MATGLVNSVLLSGSSSTSKNGDKNQFSYGLSDFWSILLEAKSTIHGTVSGCFGESFNARIRLYDQDMQQVATTETSITNPTYRFEFLDDGVYYISAEAPGYRTIWYSNTFSAAEATPLAVSIQTPVLEANFLMRLGVAPAPLPVQSSPGGADVFLNFRNPTAETTPALLDLGRIGVLSYPLNSLQRLPNQVTLYAPAEPHPVPWLFHGHEGDPTNLNHTFSLSTTSVEVITSPAGASVFVDQTESAAGITPVTLTDLAPGPHTLIFNLNGYLQPRPIHLNVPAGSNITVNLPLYPTATGTNTPLFLDSTPTGAQVWVDYLPRADVTPVQLDDLDAASHAGAGWHSVSHTIQLAAGH
ncbi:MAG: carboxypeptidase regulatory-like domain-containing protein, partial [Verrucomicrobiota bacterium]